MNWFAATLMVIWLSAAIGTAVSRNVECFEAAMITTIILAIGYAIMR